jgi:glycosyltransferase involved in cell wall biosynthesis
MNSSSLSFISVVICVFNEERILERCLAALAEQTYPNDRYEIIISDNESSDRTHEIAETFIHGLPDDAPYVKLIRIQHVGLSQSRNAGIRNSRGEILAYMDGDAIADPTWLEEIVKVFANGVDYVGGRIDLLNTDSWVAKYTQLTRHRQFFGPEDFRGHLVGCNMAFRRETLEAVGGFQETFVGRGDEVALRGRIPKEYTYRPAPNAKVRHWRPEKLPQVLKGQYFGAKNFHLVARATGRSMGLREVLGWGEKVLISLGWLLCLAGAGMDNPAIVGVGGLGMLLLFRRMFGTRIGRSILGALTENYGLIRGFLGHLAYYYVTVAIAAAGFPIGYWHHRNSSVVAPMTTPTRILGTVENRSVQVEESHGR